MIVVRLWGGLGNQMFQYAFGYSIAKKTNSNLLLDTRFYTEDFISRNPHFKKQELNLCSLNLEFKEQINRDSELTLVNILQNRTISRLIRIPPYFSIKVDRGLKYIKETRLKVYKKIIECPDTNAYYDGYWQSEDYFIDYKQELIRQYYFTNARIEETVKHYSLQDNNAVSVHMRLGDYGTKKRWIAHYNYVISPKYYIDAMNEIKIKLGNPKFYIFSNNLTKAKELLGEDYNYISINEDRYLSDLEEFIVMSKCKHHIISNSTYSWWAAWLSNNGITIAPDIVFGNNRIIPQNWSKVKVT